VPQTRSLDPVFVIAMPELPEVETVAQGLRRRALGRRISAVEVRHPGVIAGSPEEFAATLEGKAICKVSRKGKAIAVELSSDDGSSPRYLLVRLGMTGQLTVTPRDTPIEPHTHVFMPLDDGREELRFRDPRRFGRLRSLTLAELEKVLGRLGPDAQLVTEPEFLAAMRGRKGAIKSWLMNQNLVAGLGNIYADEALFEARIHPLSQPGRVSSVKARQLYKAVRKVLERAVRLGGTTFSDYLDIEGRPGAFLTKLRVYQHTGKPCRRCGHAIGRLVIGGRSSHFCPRCQARPRVTAVMRGSRGPADPLQRNHETIRPS
jgi:formamidopyrimidine-DNA glycosylase